MNHIYNYIQDEPWGASLKQKCLFCELTRDELINVKQANERRLRKDLPSTGHISCPEWENVPIEKKILYKLTGKI